MKGLSWTAIPLLLLSFAGMGLTWQAMISTTIISPEEGDKVSGDSIPVLFRVSLSRETLVAVELYVDGSLHARQDGLNIRAAKDYTLNWDTSAQSGGEHKLRVVAYSLSGRASAAEVSVFLEREIVPPPEPPEPENGVLTLVLPTGQPYTGKVTLGAAWSGTASVDRLEILVDGAVRFSAGKLGQSFIWDTTVTYDGKHALQARILSAGRLVESAVVEVLVNNRLTVTNTASLQYRPSPLALQEEVRTGPVITTILKTRRIFPVNAAAQQASDRQKE